MIASCRPRCCVIIIIRIEIQSSHYTCTYTLKYFMYNMKSVAMEKTQLLNCF